MSYFCSFFMGLEGANMPMMTFSKTGKKKKTQSKIFLSKTKEMGDRVDLEHLSELTEQVYGINFVKSHLQRSIRYLSFFLHKVSYNKKSMKAVIKWIIQ